MRIQVETSDELLAYLAAVSLREPDVLKELREHTSQLPDHVTVNGDPRPVHLMQISPEQGQFLTLLVRAIGAKRALEVGAFTGYSLICTAMGLPSNGTVIGCELNTKWADIALDYSKRAGVADRVDLRIGDAQQTLKDLIEREDAAGSFDFIFIDADKPMYDTYYEAALTLLRPNGLLVLDNVLWHGAVIDPAVNDADTTSLRVLNEKLHRDERIHLSMIPFADGLTFALKR